MGKRVNVSIKGKQKGNRDAYEETNSIEKTEEGVRVEIPETWGRVSVLSRGRINPTL